MRKILLILIILLFIIACDANKKTSSGSAQTNDTISSNTGSTSSEQDNSTVENITKSETYEKTDEYGDTTTIELIFLQDKISEVISKEVDSSGKVAYSSHGFITYNKDGKIVKLVSNYEDSKGDKSTQTLNEGDEEFPQAVKDLEDLLKEVRSSAWNRVK